MTSTNILPKLDFVITLENTMEIYKCSFHVHLPEQGIVLNFLSMKVAPDVDITCNFNTT